MGHLRIPEPTALSVLRAILRVLLGVLGFSKPAPAKLETTTSPYRTLGVRPEYPAAPDPEVAVEERMGKALPSLRSPLVFEALSQLRAQAERLRDAERTGGHHDDAERTVGHPGVPERPGKSIPAAEDMPAYNKPIRS